MANKTEKDETDQLKAPETLALCTPSISSSDDLRSDLNTGVTVDSTSSSGSSTNRPDLNRKSCSPAVNRCSGCRRKVGLTGFRCRCGEMFCSDHRYSDRHDCCFDYKAAGREAIARENPVVRAAKILKGLKWMERLLRPLEVCLRHVCSAYVELEYREIGGVYRRDEGCEN